MTVCVCVVYNVSKYKNNFEKEFNNYIFIVKVKMAMECVMAYIEQVMHCPSLTYGFCNVVFCKVDNITLNFVL